MEILNVEEAKSVAIGFKIDLIVWKCRKCTNLKWLFGKFKIDLIVWKLNFSLL